MKKIYAVCVIVLLTVTFSCQKERQNLLPITLSVSSPTSANTYYPGQMVPVQWSLQNLDPSKEYAIEVQLNDVVHGQSFAPLYPDVAVGTQGIEYSIIPATVGAANVMLPRQGGGQDAGNVLEYLGPNYQLSLSLMVKENGKWTPTQITALSPGLFTINYQNLKN